VGLDLRGFYCEVPAKLRSTDDGEAPLSGGAWGQEPQCAGRCLQCRLRGGMREFFASRSSALSATGPLAQPQIDRELIFVWALGPKIKVELEAVC
jgi:hypothetical protein